MKLVNKKNTFKILVLFCAFLISFIYITPHIVGFLKLNKQGAEYRPMSLEAGRTTHFYDVVDANILAMNNKNLGKGEVINIGTGERYSVNYITSLIGGETKNIAPRIEPHDTEANILKAKNILGWSPIINFEQGIEELKAIYL